MGGHWIPEIGKIICSAGTGEKEAICFDFLKRSAFFCFHDNKDQQTRSPTICDFFCNESVAWPFSPSRWYTFKCDITSAESGSVTYNCCHVTRPAIDEANSQVFSLAREGIKEQPHQAVQVSVRSFNVSWLFAFSKLQKNELTAIATFCVSVSWGFFPKYQKHCHFLLKRHRLSVCDLLSVCLH